MKEPMQVLKNIFKNPCSKHLKYTQFNTQHTLEVIQKLNIFHVEK